ncbi:hypothetical protein JX266_006155 [Neoarthrinium moseri]|nr:hypothetical protein JX266_006155 [Neoarthrinium moseri]
MQLNTNTIIIPSNTQDHWTNYFFKMPLTVKLSLSLLLLTPVLAIPATSHHAKHHGHIVRTVPNFTSLGCYTEASSGRAIELASYSSNSMTTQSCAAFCASYRFFGTEYGRECFCGNALAASAVPTSSGCSMSCAGKPAQTCGGASRISLYRNNDYVAPAVAGVPGRVYLGCHSEGEGERLLPDRSAPSDTQTPQKCAAACAGFRYAGLEYGRECWCGNALHGGGFVGEAECSFVCAGDAGAQCGAGNRLTLYETVQPPANGTA